MTKELYTKAILQDMVVVEVVEDGKQEFHKVPKDKFKENGVKFTLDNTANYTTLNKFLKENKSFI